MNDNLMPDASESPVVGLPVTPPDQVEETEPFVVSDALQSAIDETLGDIRSRSFAHRNNLGKMINCPVCTRRHYGAQCEPTYAILHVEEDLETGVKTNVYRVANQKTRKGVLGAAVFAKKRLHPHLNQRKLQFIERVRTLFGFGTFDEDTAEFKAALKVARTKASRQLRAERIERAATRRHMQNVSRRINWELLPAGSR